MDDDYGPGVDLDGRKSRKGGSGVVLPGSEGYNKGASYNLNGTQVDADGNEIKNQKRNDAAEDLRNNEDASVNKGGDEDKAGLPGVREKEESGDFTSSVTGKKSERGKKKGKGDVKGFFKKKGAIGFIIALVLGGGTVSFFGLSTQLNAWKENIYSIFGQSSAVINRRSNFVLRRLLTFNQKKFKINKDSKLVKKLRAEGIDYAETEVDGKKVKMFVFEDADGTRIPVVASDNDIGAANKLVRAGAEVDIDGARVRLTADAQTLSGIRSKNKNFELKFSKGTASFTSKIAGWFDNMTFSLLRRIVGKNARNQMDIEDPTEESVNQRLLGNASEGVGDSKIKATVEEGDENGKPTSRLAQTGDAVEVETDVDADGNPITIVKKTYGDIASENGSIKPGSTDTETVVRTSLTARAQKFAMMGASLSCAVLRGMGGISAAIGAVQTMNVISYASKYLELADKIKAGDADETVNIALANINTPTKVTMTDLDDNKVIVEGSVTSSDGWNAVFSSTNIVNENDPSALLVNREYTSKYALKKAIGGGTFSELASGIANLGGSIKAFRTCNNIQLAMGVAGAVGTFLAFVTGGIGKVVEEAITGAIKGAAFAGAMGILSVVISATTPMIARWFVGELWETFLGKNGGFALLSGAQNIMNSNLQMSTGRYADKANVVQVFALTKDVEKEWAAYERATKSAFDVTSKYTFLGSIYNSVLPLVNSSNNVMTQTLPSLAGLAGSSALALINPSASAAGEVNDFSASLASEDNCSYLSAAGVAGDFACNKYAGAYVDELTTKDPNDVYEYMKSKGAFSDEEFKDGNPKVKANSNYAKYLVACVTNDAQPGTMSGAVQGFIQKFTDTGNDVANGLINFGMNFVPGEDFLDVADAIEQEKNMKWNSGIACTGNTDDPDFNEEVMNYSLYNLDQRTLYDMEIIDENSSVAFLEEYYEENPLDDTFEGRIARFSGMTKEEVSDTLALIEYYQFIAEYKPLERYAFGEPEVEKELKFDNEHTLAVDVMIPPGEIVYADVRNRNFVV